MIGQLLLEITYSSYFKGHFSSPPFFEPHTFFSLPILDILLSFPALSPHLFIQPPYFFREAFALQLHVLHIDLSPGSRPPCRHAGLHHGDHVPQLLQQAHLTPRGCRRVDIVSETSTKSETLQILTVNVKEHPCYNGSLVLNLAQDCSIFSFQLWALPALSELFVLRDGDLEQPGRLHQGGHHCLPLPDLPLERIQHLVGALAVKPGRLHEPTQAPINTHTHTHICKSPV